jgi:hypothetical protein
MMLAHRAGWETKYIACSQSWLGDKVRCPPQSTERQSMVLAHLAGWVTKLTPCQVSRLGGKELANQSTY